MTFRCQFQHLRCFLRSGEALVVLYYLLIVSFFALKYIQVEATFRLVDSGVITKRDFPEEFETYNKKKPAERLCIAVLERIDDSGFARLLAAAVSGLIIQRGLRSIDCQQWFPQTSWYTVLICVAVTIILWLFYLFSVYPGSSNPSPLYNTFFVDPRPCFETIAIVQWIEGFWNIILYAVIGVILTSALWMYRRPRRDNNRGLELTLNAPISAIVIILYWFVLIAVYGSVVRDKASRIVGFDNYLKTGATVLQMWAPFAVALAIGCHLTYFRTATLVKVKWIMVGEALKFPVWIWLRVRGAVVPGADANGSKGSDGAGRGQS